MTKKQKQTIKEKAEEIAGSMELLELIAVTGELYKIMKKRSDAYFKTHLKTTRPR
jgi:hypothetical protein